MNAQTKIIERHLAFEWLRKLALRKPFPHASVALIAWREAVTKKQKAEEALLRIKQIIEGVDARAMAADGPVTPTDEEIQLIEIQKIYALASGRSENWRPGEKCRK
jgi:hypothetical protein